MGGTSLIPVNPRSSAFPDYNIFSVSWLRGRSTDGEGGLSAYMGDHVELPPVLARKLAPHSISHGLAGGFSRPRLITKPGAG